MANIRLWLKVARIVALFGYGLILAGIVFPLLVYVLGRTGLAWRGQLHSRWCWAVCQVLGVRLRTSGVADPRARLWVANHVSWLDIVVLGGQQPLIFLSKAEVADWPVIGFLARRCGTLFVRRGDRQATGAAVEQLLWRLRQGQRVMVFPEGTTTDGSKVLRFHARFLQPAVMTQSVVQPVALRYVGTASGQAPFVGDDEFLPHLLRILRLPHIDVDLHFCESIAATGSLDTVARTARQRIVDLLTPPGVSDFAKASGEGR